jgi:hypothetical protein
MERQLRAVEQMDPIESAALLALPVVEAMDLEAEETLDATFG